METTIEYKKSLWKSTLNKLLSNSRKSSAKNNVARDEEKHETVDFNLMNCD